MKKNKTEHLLNRYLSAQESGKEVYFDADEIDEILEDLEEKEDFTYYEQILTLGIRLHPGNTDLRIKQCKWFIFNESFEEALTLINRIAETGDLEVDLLRLECYCALDQYDQVVSYVESHIDENRKDLEEVFEYLIPVMSDFEMEEEKEDFIERGLRLFPENLILKDELCQHKESIGDFEGAIKICNELIDKNPYSVDDWYSLGRLYYLIGNYEKAVEAFDFGLTCDGSDREMKLLKSYTLFKNKNYAKAIESYEELLETEDDEIADQIKLLIAQCYIELPNQEEAYKILQDYFERQKKEQEEETGKYIEDDFYFYYRYIISCMETGRTKEGWKVIQEALKYYPKDYQLNMMMMGYVSEDNMAEFKPCFFSLVKNAKAAMKNMESKKKISFKDLMLKIKNQYALQILNVEINYLKKLQSLIPRLPFVNMHIALSYLFSEDFDQFKNYYQKVPIGERKEFFKSEYPILKRVEKRLKRNDLNLNDLMTDNDDSPNTEIDEKDLNLDDFLRDIKNSLNKEANKEEFKIDNLLENKKDSFNTKNDKQHFSFGDLINKFFGTKRNLN